MTAPLSRNRNYRVLWGSQVLSEFGFNAAAIAFPLLVLAVTGSAAASGLVLGTIAAARLVAGLPAGALVDRWNRKRIMLACEAAQAVSAGSLVAALWWGVASVPHMVVVAAVIGVCSALFEPAEDASLPNLVPTEQLSTAVAMNSARSYLGHLAGTASGGFLFAAGRLVPFAVEVLTHTTAFVALLSLRVPPRQARPELQQHLGREMVTGLRWVWGHRHIRTTALCAIVLNLFFNAFYLVVIVLAQTRGVPSGQIGVMAAMLGVGGVVGALFAPYLHRVLSSYQSIIGVFWALTALTPLAVLAGNGYLMGALFFAMALLPPTANTTIMTEQLLLTPDALRGRLSGVIGLATGVAAAVGPALGGVLVSVLSANQAVLFCAGGIAAVTLLVTVSPTLRGFPRHTDVPPTHVPTTDIPTTDIPTAGVPTTDVPTSGVPTSGVPTTDVRVTDLPVPPDVPMADVPVTDVPMEGDSKVDENARYEVLRNDEDQYSLWLAGHEVPAGWHKVGKEGTKDECSAYVDEVWTDMRPRSLREWMDSAAKS